MRKLLIVLLLAAGCRSQTTAGTTTTPAPAPAAATVRQDAPRPALDAFLASVRNQDLQAMSLVWGDKDGPVRDSRKMSRDEMEKRELILMCYFGHDRYRVVGDTPGTDGERVLQVELTKGTLRRTTNFYLAHGHDRWYVRSADIEPVKELCASRR